MGFSTTNDNDLCILHHKHIDFFIVCSNVIHHFPLSGQNKFQFRYSKVAPSVSLNLSNISASCELEGIFM